MRKIEKSHPCIVTPDGFKQALQKYASRHAKGDAVFGLLSMYLDNLSEITKSEGGQAARMLSESLLRACLDGLRQQDRVCFPCDDFFLFLLPDASAEGVEQAANRINKILAQAKVKQEGRVLKPQGTVLFAHCGAECDIDAMLHRVGATVDEHGGISKRSDHARRPHFAQLDSWAQRYEEFPTRGNGNPALAKDKWSSKPVKIQELPCAAGQSHWEDVVKRARALQTIEHPAVNRLLDFHVDERLHTVYLVWPYLEGVRLSQALKDKQSIEPVVALSWIGEIIGALTYLGTLVPPAVPVKFTTEHIAVSGTDLMLDGALDDYVCDLQSGTSSQKHLFSQIAVVMASILQKTDSAKVPGELNDVVTQLQFHDVPQKLNTLHKLRSAVRKIIERADKRSIEQGTGHA